MTFTDPEEGFEGCINSASDVATFGSICSNTIQRFLLLHSLDRWPTAGLSNQVTTALLVAEKLPISFLDTSVALIFVDDSTNG